MIKFDDKKINEMFLDCNEDLINDVLYVRDKLR